MGVEYGGGGGASAHGDLTGVTADQHHARQHGLDSASDHTGTITAAQHGTVASGNLHPEYASVARRWAAVAP